MNKLKYAGIKIFLYLFIPRLLLSIFFTSFDHFGVGGDGDIYHAAALDLRNHLLGETFTFRGDRTFFKTDYDLISYWGVENKIRQLFVDGNIIEGFFNSTVPHILFHTLLYLLIPSPLFYVILQSLAISLAYKYLFLTYRPNRKVYLLLLLNPFSIYFSATHMKEAWTEFLFIIIFTNFLLTNRKNMLYFSSLLFLYRYEFVFFVLPLFFYERLTNYLSKRNILKILLIVSIAIVFIPYLGVQREFSSLNYSNLTKPIFTNEYSAKTLGVLLGILQPLPFTYPLRYYNYIGGIFFLIAGLFNLIITYKLFYKTFINNKINVIEKSTLIYVWFILITISYNFLYTYIGYKERYFSPFVFMIIIFLFNESKKVWDNENITYNNNN